MRFHRFRLCLIVIHRFRFMPITISLLSLGNALRAIFMLLLTKLVAFSYGPSLVALGSLQNILGILAPVSSLGTNSAATLLISKAKQEKLNSVILTLVFVLLVGSLIGIALLFLLLSYFNNVMPANVELNVTALIIYCFSSSLFAIAAGYLQGRTLIASFAYGTIIGSVINLMFLVWAASGWSLNNTINLAVFQLAINAFVLLFILRKDIWKWLFSTKKFQFSLVGSLLQVGLFSLTSGVILSAGFINIRQVITEDMGIVAAGNWDAAIRTFPIISLLVCMPIFSRYFSSLCIASKTSELFSIYKQIMFITFIPFSLGLTIIFLFPSLIVELLFSDSFVLYIQTIMLFIVGDIIRSYATLLNYFNLASLRYTRHFIGELVFIVTLLFLITFIPINSFDQLALFYIVSSSLSLTIVGIFFMGEARNLSYI